MWAFAEHRDARNECWIRRFVCHCYDGNEVIVLIALSLQWPQGNGSRNAIETFGEVGSGEAMLYSAHQLVRDV
jgi:hypothetical protein